MYIYIYNTPIPIWLVDACGFKKRAADHLCDILWFTRMNYQVRCARSASSTEAVWILRIVLLGGWKVLGGWGGSWQARPFQKFLGGLEISCFTKVGVGGWRGRNVKTRVTAQFASLVQYFVAPSDSDPFVDKAIVSYIGVLFAFLRNIMWHPDL